MEIPSHTTLSPESISLSGPSAHSYSAEVFGSAGNQNAVAPIAGNTDNTIAMNHVSNCQSGGRRRRTKKSRRSKKSMKRRGGKSSKRKSKSHRRR